MKAEAGPVAVAVAVHPLFVHIVGACSLEEQRELLEKAKSLRGSSSATPYRYGFDKLAALELDSGPFLQMSERLRDMATKASESLASFSSGLPFGALEILGYREDSKLVPHVDWVSGLAVIVSLGATANFFFKTAVI